MKNLCVAFACLLIGSAAWGQKLPKVYTDIVEKYNEQNYESIIGLTKEVDVLAKNRKDTIVANSYYYIANAYRNLGNPENAISWFEKEKVLRSDLGLKATSEFSGALYNLAIVYLEAGQYAKAETMAADLLENDKRVYGATTEAYISTVQSVADIYTQLDKFSEAEKITSSVTARTR